MQLNRKCFLATFFSQPISRNSFLATHFSQPLSYVFSQPFSRNPFLTTVISQPILQPFSRKRFLATPFLQNFYRSVYRTVKMLKFFMRLEVILEGVVFLNYKRIWILQIRAQLSNSVGEDKSIRGL